MFWVFYLCISKIRRDGYEYYVSKRWTVLALFCANIGKLELHFPEFPYVFDFTVGG